MRTASDTIDAVAPPSHCEATGVANRDKNNAGRPANPEGPNKPLGVRPKPKVRRALEKYIADQEVAVTSAAVLAAALEEFLRTRGYLSEES
jgi:hypothetical protein